jgi:hypothetical protein
MVFHLELFHHSNFIQTGEKFLLPTFDLDQVGIYAAQSVLADRFPALGILRLAQEVEFNHLGFERSPALADHVRVLDLAGFNFLATPLLGKQTLP